MPHLVANYSANLTELDQHTLLSSVNSALIATHLFSPNDVKSRIFKDEAFLIGMGETQDAYIHLKLYLLSGRTAAQKQDLGSILLTILEQKNYLPVENQLPLQLCVEVIDMPSEYYFKASI
ncbi:MULTISPECIES: 5-carboxymethyl-2-hydroxymuconate Delta-isomerase [Acinetobacter]|jgi:5-carboxymethyl-2-hydroxymuconate isomerase|uniref:5-carboxymethyl-2-hydroxymuconate Delta-isomerase n=1 Tax=Acinetobacter TaxID=469 RepID=UPI00044AB7B4|nr:MULTISPECIES: 5-carboxymethyl-2-hydroxymuconate Delta-isomerase [Acinetobacter]EXB49067.1 5-carboxymethyl-2-hydroxymuconate isomerase family protein [Acinetobacter baumannii 146457]EYT21369.1 5-carboxymethyl-2-hydroxymuconate isomerase family protein [Acinetobacter sp. 1000160]MEB3790309.1 5-carboxymethyl-2-hydroxymuconate Delta-isomerase [Acinetobacter sp. IK40]